MTDIIDRIDSLIDEQLAAGEPRNGYDYDDPDYPKCWHCSRDWHGLKITERMERMRMYGQYDEDYSYADDDSAVICPGSTFIGPVMSPGVRNWYVQEGSWQLPQPEYHYISPEQWIWGTRSDYGLITQEQWQRIEYMQSSRRDLQFSVQLGSDPDAPWIMTRDESEQEDAPQATFTLWNRNFEVLARTISESEPVIRLSSVQTPGFIRGVSA